MPESALWGLVVSLALLAFGLTLKIADLLRQLDHSKNDVASLRVKMSESEKQKDDAIAKLQEHETRDAYRVTQQRQRMRANRSAQADSEYNPLP